MKRHKYMAVSDADWCLAQHTIASLNETDERQERVHSTELNDRWYSPVPIQLFATRIYILWFIRIFTSNYFVITSAI
jgi:hypothetical protein